jgi:hypothetical protein
MSFGPAKCPLESKQLTQGAWIPLFCSALDITAETANSRIALVCDTPMPTSILYCKQNDTPETQASQFSEQYILLHSESALDNQP